MADRTAPAADIAEKDTLSQYARMFLSGLDTLGGQSLGGPSEPYNEHVWTHACIFALHSNAARVPIRLSRGEPAGTSRVWGQKHIRAGLHRRRELLSRRLGPNEKAAVYKAHEGEIVETGELHALLERPNAEQTWPQFVTETVCLMYTCGSVHWLLLDMVGRRPREIIAVPGHKSTAVVDKSGMVARLVGWQIRDPHGTPRTVTLDECITFSLYNPRDRNRGLAPREPASLAIASDYNASIYNAAMFHNSCEPGGLLETEAPYNEEQDSQMWAKWQQRHGGPSNARKLAILWGGLKYKQMANSLTEMVYPEGKRLSREEVCAVFRVPASVAGFVGVTGDSTALVGAELQRFWQDTMAPLVGRIAEGIDVHLAPRFEGSLEAWADVEDVPVYQEMRLARLDAADKLFAKGVPMSDVDAMLDLGLPQRPWHDVGFLPMNLVPAQEAAEGNVVEPVDENPPEDSDEIGQSGFSNRGSGGSGGNQDQDGVKPETSPPSASSATSVANTKASEAGKKRIWKSWITSWSPLAKRFRGMLRTHYSRQEEQILKLLRRAVSNEQLTMSKADESAINSILFQVFGKPDSKKKFRGRIKAFMADASKLGIRQALVEAGLEGEQLAAALKELMSSGAITSAMASDSVRISTLVDNKTRQHLKRTLMEGIDDGEGIRKLTSRVQEIMGSSRRSAMVTARNAVGQSLSRARHAGHKKAGMTHKTWLHSRGPGERREAHVAAESRYAGANAIPLDEPFVINGIPLMYPRDFASGSPAETVNCQCLQLAARRRKGAEVPASEIIESYDNGIGFATEGTKDTEDGEALCLTADGTSAPGDSNA